MLYKKAKKHYHIYDTKGLKCLKKGDIALMLAAVILFIVCVCFPNNGSRAAIYVDGELYKRLPLSENTRLTVKTQFGENTVVVEDGSVYVTSSDCPDKLCEKERTDKSARAIICLPNRLCVIIESENKDNETDVIL